MEVGLISYLLLIQRDLSKALSEKKLDFPEMFDDYERYHEVVETGKLLRAKLVEDWIEPNSTVLDVGVGDGVMSEYFVQSRHVDVVGLDISNKACEKAKRRGIKAEIRDINNGLGIEEDKYYDYVLLSEVIEHTMYPHRILIDAIRHTKKGVIVTIPNSGYVKWRIQLLRGYVPRQSFTHLHNWSIKDFELFCKTLDIQILAFTTVLPDLLLRFRNLFAWQQCWLLAPKSAE
jgi:methionine biosynthesis protein MetW